MLRLRLLLRLRLDPAQKHALANGRIQAAPGTKQNTDADAQRLVDAVLDPDAVIALFPDHLSAPQIADRILRYRPLVV